MGHGLPAGARAWGAEGGGQCWCKCPNCRHFAFVMTIHPAQMLRLRGRCTSVGVACALVGRGTKVASTRTRTQPMRTFAHTQPAHLLARACGPCAPAPLPRHHCTCRALPARAHTHRVRTVCAARAYSAQATSPLRAVRLRRSTCVYARPVVHASSCCRARGQCTHTYTRAPAHAALHTQAHTRARPRTCSLVPMRAKLHAAPLHACAEAWRAPAPAGPLQA